MATAQLTIVIDAQNNATAALNETKDQLNGVSEQQDETASSSEKLGGAFSGMAGQFVAGMVVFTVAQKVLSGIKSVISDGIATYETYQQNQAAMAQQLKATNDASGQTVQGLDKYADQLSSVTNITGNAINAGQMMLLNYGEISKNMFPQATKTATDLATALAHGAVPNTQQMTQASKLLGKALEDPTTGVTAFTRAGVTFSTSQVAVIKAMMKTGDTAGAQQQLLTDLSNVVGGRAVAAAHTLAGEEAGLKAQFDKIVVVVGNDLINAFKKLEPYLAKFLDFLTKHKAIIAIVAGAVIGLAVAIGVALVVALWGMVSAAVAAVAALWPIIAVGAAVALAAYLISSNWKKIKQDLKPVTDFFNQELLPIFKKVYDMVVGNLMSAWHSLEKAFDEIMTAIKPIEPMLKTLAKVIGITLVAAIALPIAAFVALVTVGAIVISWIAKLVGWVVEAIAWFISFEIGIARSIAHFVGDVVGGIGTVISWFTSLGSKILNAIGDFGTLLYDAGKDLIQGLVNGVKGALHLVADVGKDIGNTAKNAVKDVLSIFSPSRVFAELGANVAAGFAQGIKGGTNEVGNVSSAMAQTAVTSASTPTSNIINNSPSNSSNSSTTVNIQQVVLSTAQAVNEFIQQLNIDTLSVGKGITPNQGVS